MLRLLVTGFILFIGVNAAFSEDTATPSTPPPNLNMQEAVVGDHWTYNVTDEITGETKPQRKVIVTDVSKKEIATRFDIGQTGRSGAMLYDTSWNIINSDGWRYSPNDGTGIHQPLTPGAQWKVTADATNLANGRIFKRSGNSRVTGQEAIATKAGKFDTVVFDTTYVSRDTKDPTRSTEITNRTWYSTDLNHWIRRTLVVRQSGHVIINEKTELAEYGRKN